MHIAEGMLPVPYAVGYGVGAAVFVAAGAYSLRERTQEIPMLKQLTGVMAAGIFIISLLPIPMPGIGSSSHPGGTPLGAILLGPWITALISMVALLFQALFFAHGGLSTLGANTLTMGVFGGLVGWVIFKLARRTGASLFWAAFCAGVIGDISIYVGTSIQLALAIHGHKAISSVFLEVFLVFLPTQAPIAFIEGIFTGLVLKYIATNRPDILITLKVISSMEQLRSKSELAKSKEE